MEMKLEYPFVELCRRLQTTEAKVDKYKESSNILARVGHDSTPEESTSGVVVAVNNVENPKQNSQSHTQCTECSG